MEDARAKILDCAKEKGAWSASSFLHEKKVYIEGSNVYLSSPESELKNCL